MTLLAEGASSPSAAPWVGAGLGIIALGFGVVRLWFFLKDRKAKHAETKQISEISVAGAQEKQSTEARRNATEEAWEVVDRLNDEVVRLNERMERMEEAHRKDMEAANKRTELCEKEHAATRQLLGETRGVLSVLRAWAEKKGLVIPPMDGSGLHTPLP